MRKLLACAALSLLAAGGCGDATGPAALASLAIGGAPTAALAVGDTLTLSATLLDETGATVTNRAVAWRSTAPAVVSVSGAGRVTALAVGQAWIVASVEDVADSVSITVAAPTGSRGCQPDAPGVSLAVGEVRLVSLDGRGAACLEAAAGGAEMVLVAFNGRTAGTLAVNVLGSGIGAAPAASASRAPATTAALGGADGPRVRDGGFEAALRARERAELGALVPGARAARSRAGTRASLAAAEVPPVGSLLNLNVSLQACTRPDLRVGRVAAVTERAVIVADTANPAGGFTDAEYREMGLTFDTLVYPVDVANFGEPTDLDANGRTVLFFTRAVNELTERDSESFVGGFFFARDLFPRAAQNGYPGCAGSNYAEMFYVLAPDPSGTVNGNDFSKDFVRRNSTGIIAHELQHLISAARRLYVLQTADYDEEVWLNEGLSHIAEELVFYRAAGAGPGQNLGPDRIRSSAALVDAFNRYAAPNFGRLDEYLKNPEESSPFDDDDELATRGATWAFLRYAADRRGGDQTALWNRLVNSELTGLANLRAALGSDPLELARDWTASVYADDALPTPAAYQQPSWNFRALYAAFSSSSGYPLRTHALVDGVPTPVTLEAGTGAFFRLSVPALARAEVRLASGGAAPTGVSVFVMRTR